MDNDIAQFTEKQRVRRQERIDLIGYLTVCYVLDKESGYDLIRLLSKLNAREIHLLYILVKSIV